MGGGLRSRDSAACVIEAEEIIRDQAAGEEFFFLHFFLLAAECTMLIDCRADF